MSKHFTHPAFELFGNEARTRVAIAFIPDPGVEISVPQLSEVIGKPQASLNDGVSKLMYRGLLERGDPNQAGPRTFKRVEHPMWAVYETAKLAFAELGIEMQSIVETPEPEL